MTDVPVDAVWLLRRGLRALYLEVHESIAYDVTRLADDALAQTWDRAVDAAFAGAITRQNAEDVKRTNPYRAEPQVNQESET